MLKTLFGVCCRLLICCPPDRAAAALAEHEGIPLEVAAKIHAGYQLVPKLIEVGAGPTDSDRVALARKRLEKLHHRNEVELKAILLDLGHGVQEGS